jgi:hypothetical protein
LANAQRDSVNNRRLRTVVIGSAAAYTVTLAGLNSLWYADSKRQSFRFFDDNSEWKQVDKLGHFYSAFYFSYGMSRVLQWSRVPASKADLIGAITGFAVLVPVEIFDGFSDAYGASTGDLIADAGGAAFYLAQTRLWKEPRIFPKFSFHRTGYASIRPDLLGDNLAGEILKDYNGQTYWLSVDMDKFIRFPKWLNIAAGYGANDMVFARDNQNRAAGYNPYRQYYIGFDFDPSAIRTRSKVIKTLLFVANLIKIPAPALEFSSRHGVRVHALAF